MSENQQHMPPSPPAPDQMAVPPSQYAAAPSGYSTAPPSAPTNVLAIVSLISSIVGFLGIVVILGSIVGIVTGHIGAKQIRERGEQGEGLAKAGLIVGYIGLGLWVIGAIIFFAFFAFVFAASEVSTID